MTPRPQVRCFGTPYYWTRLSATEWEFDDGWGTYRLTRCRRNPADERWDTGWYLTHPDDEDGEYMGATITAAITNEYTLKALHDGHHRREK